MGEPQQQTFTDVQPIQAAQSFTDVQPIPGVTTLSDARTIPNARIRNMTVDPTKNVHSTGQAFYEGAKMGLTAASIPAAAYLTPVTAATGLAGGTAGSIAGQKIAEKAGAGEFGQEVGSDVGGLAGGAIAAGTAEAAIGKVKSLYGALPADIQKEVLGVLSPRLAHALKIGDALGIGKEAPGVYPGAPYPEHPGELELHPVYPGAPNPTATPEQLNPALVSPARTLPGMIPPEVTQPQVASPAVAPIPSRSGLMLTGETAGTYPGAPLPERPDPALLRARSLMAGAQQVVDPAAGLGNIPVRTAPPGSAGSIVQSVTSPVKPANLQALIEQGLGNKPLDLKPNVSLKDQYAALKGLPDGHTAVDSTAVKSFMYDLDAREFQTLPVSGKTIYVHGDVSPEEAQAFADADSKGKAWMQIRNNPLVAKIVNGVRIPVKPVKNLGDLTDILQQSLDQVNATKKTQ